VSVGSDPKYPDQEKRAKRYAGFLGPSDTVSGEVPASGGFPEKAEKLRKVVEEYFDQRKDEGKDESRLTQCKLAARRLREYLKPLCGMSSSVAAQQASSMFEAAKNILSHPEIARAFGAPEIPDEAKKMGWPLGPYDGSGEELINTISSSLADLLSNAERENLLARFAVLQEVAYAGMRSIKGVFDPAWEKKPDELKKLVIEQVHEWHLALAAVRSHERGVTEAGARGLRAVG